jgi:hypothetical protein
MSVITTGKTFANGEQLTADKLNQVIDQATFNASEAVDGSTITLISGAMAVNDNGITEAKIDNGAVTTDKIANGNVTKAKIENVANMKVLGNTSGSDAAPEEVSILNENDMNSDSDTALATQQSIKAYVDSSITADGTVPGHTGGVANEGEQGSISIANLIIKYGTLDANSSQTDYTFTSEFPTSIIGVNATPQENYSTSAEGCSVDNLDKTGFTVRTYASSSGAAAGKVFWMAIGY